MVKSKAISTLTEYISFVEKNCKKENILFRGQQQDWPLKPKLARLKLKPGKRLRPTEYKMVRDFKRLSLPHIKINLQHNMDVLVFAQHNGMATRLLDWTMNPLAGLWFAVRKPSVKKLRGKPKDGVVWIYRVSPRNDRWAFEGASPYPKEGILIHRPNHVTPQITAQQGLFTIHGYSEDGEGFTPMEEHKPYCNRLSKLVIPATAFSELRYQLDRCGINEATMFPGVGGLCRHIEWFNTLLEDE